MKRLILVASALLIVAGSGMSAAERRPSSEGHDYLVRACLDDPCGTTTFKGNVVILGGLEVRGECDNSNGGICDCPPGPTGPPGNTGPPGMKGDKGETGETGNTGSAGMKGMTGPTGPKGNTGFPGSTGMKGMTGPTGPKGNTGFPGSTGMKGMTGPTGPSGTAGMKGETGETGAVGATGPAGTGLGSCRVSRDGIVTIDAAGMGMTVGGTEVVKVIFEDPPSDETFGGFVDLFFIGNLNSGDHEGSDVTYFAHYYITTGTESTIVLEGNDNFSQVGTDMSNGNKIEPEKTSAASIVVSGNEVTIRLAVKSGESATGLLCVEGIFRPGQLDEIIIGPSD